MRRTTLGPLSSADLNSSALDVSAISGLGDLTANYGGRTSLNTSGIGKMMLNKSIIAPGTGKKPTIGRPSLAAGVGASDRRVPTRFPARFQPTRAVVVDFGCWSSVLPYCTHYCVR